MKRIIVKPVAGKAVRSPLPPYERLPAEGSVRIDAPAWRRLAAAGDITIDQEPAPQRSGGAKKEA